MKNTREDFSACHPEGAEGSFHKDLNRTQNYTFFINNFTFSTKVFKILADIHSESKNQILPKSLGQGKGRFTLAIKFMARMPKTKIQGGINYEN